MHWRLRDGPSDENAWLASAYDAQATLVTKVGTLHADHAEPGATSQGWPTSSATLPNLVIAMYRHARIYEGADVLDVGTGSGYGCALLTHRLGAEHVTTIDVDRHITAAAAERLEALGLKPIIVTGDATRELPGSYDRIVPMVSMRAVPASWLTALRPSGRLVFSLTGGSVVITANKTPDGGAKGKVEQYNASFMAARHKPDSTPPPGNVPDAIRCADGEDVSISRYPVVDPTWGWELDAMLSVIAPGIVHNFDSDKRTGIRTAWMLHEDGSWARATGTRDEPAVVHQSGPRRLWDILDDIRHNWITHGALPLRGANVIVDPDGTCHLSQGKWRATIASCSDSASS